MKLWWEQVVDIAEACKDLEWLAYANLPLDTDELSGKEYDELTGPLSEQIWAMREGLA